MFPIFPEGRGGGSVHRQINLLMAADCFMRNAILAEYQYTGFTISYSIFPGMVKILNPERWDLDSMYCIY